MVTKIYLPAMRACRSSTACGSGLGVAIIGTLLAETKLSNRGIGFLIIQAYCDLRHAAHVRAADRAVRARDRRQCAGRPARRASTRSGTMKQRRSAMKRLTTACAAARSAALAIARLRPTTQVKPTIGQRGNWDTAVDRISAARPASSRSTTSSSRLTLHLGQRRDPAAGDLRQRRSRPRGRHARRDGGLSPRARRCASSAPGDRRRRLLVRQRRPRRSKRCKDTNGKHHRVLHATAPRPTRSCAPSSTSSSSTAKPHGDRQSVRRRSPR